MKLHFQDISLEKAGAYNEHLAQCGQRASDYSFINLWGWAEAYGLQWAWQDDLVWIRQTVPEVVNWAPVGRWDARDWRRLLETHRRERIGFVRVPSSLCRMWETQAALGEKAVEQESRGDWDYLYNCRELVELKGNRFHKKKNLLNQFVKKVSFRYEPFDNAMVSQALAMQQDWCTWRDCESLASLAAENRAISRVLDHWERLPNIMGGAILVEEKMAAYTISERLDADTLLIHFEKGDAVYRGIYQAINQLFLENAGAGFQLVNREQDLGDEGLRKAKLSYHPVDFVEKYRIDWR